MSSLTQPLADNPQLCGQKTKHRVSVACLNCRKKRIRCDGDQPSCGPCDKHAVSCEYQFTENKRKPPSKAYVRSLEARIQCLEAALATKNANLAPSCGPENDDAITTMQFIDNVESEPRDLLSDVTGVFGRLNVGDDGQPHYFGSQSNYNLLQDTLNQNSMETTVSMQREGLEASQRLGRSMPLSRELQEHLLDLFWTWHNPWNYIIHKKAFCDAVESRTYGKFCTPLLLSAIFALASRYSDRPEVRSVPEDLSTAGYAFLEQAKIMLLYESQVPTVATVQAAALMGIRAMSDNEEALGWLYCGNAVRMAYNLGLNLDCSRWVEAGLISAEEAEVRRVAWWGCYSLDKLFSISLGRPACTSKRYITCPMPSLDNCAEFEAWNPELKNEKIPPGGNMQSRTVSTGQALVDCLTIASEAMHSIYAPNSCLSKDEIQGIVAKADLELRAYYVHLPSHLRLPLSQQSIAPAHIYQLHMQYHVNLILLHRPLLPKYEARPPDSSISSFLWDDSHMVTCRDSALAVVKLLRIFKNHYTMRYAAIVTIHISFTAAVIHLIDAKDNKNPHYQQAIRGLDTCMSALEGMKPTWCAWSAKALNAIQNLAEQCRIDLPI